MIVIVPDELNPAYEGNALIWVSDHYNDYANDTGIVEPENIFITGATILATGMGMVQAVLHQVSLALLLKHLLTKYKLLLTIRYVGS